MAYTVEFDNSSAPPLVRVRIHGTLTKADFIAMAREVIDLETRETLAGRRPPSRLTDLRGLEQIELGYADVRGVVESRRHNTLRTPVRSAVIVETPLHRGFGRMYQTLNDHPMVSLELFESEAAALEWIGGK